MKKLFMILILMLSPLMAWAQAEVQYMSYWSSKVVGRPLKAAEITAIKSNGKKAYPSILQAWTKEVGFEKSIRIYVENLMKISGETTTVNYDQVGYLAIDLVRKNRPYSELLTANYCLDKNMQVTNCGTGSPYNAGVLTTKAFLTSYRGAFNISRAGKLISKFLCTSYPLPDSEEPRLTEEELVPQFSTKNGPITFGNGNNCYSCHSQFGLHAQLFVKFDNSGMYQASATGLQNPDPSITAGFSTNGLATSHMKLPIQASSEQTRMLGKTVKNISEGAAELIKSPRFYPCAAKNLMKYFLHYSDNQVDQMKPELFSQISQQASALSPQPSFSDLTISMITNEAVYQSFLKAGVQP